MLLFFAVIENDIIRNKLEEIYLLYNKDLWFVANSILNDEHEAEDVVQTAFIRISEYLDENFDVRCNKTRGLIVIIVRRIAINIYNQRKRRSAADIKGLIGSMEDPDHINPEHEVIRLEQSTLIARRMEQLKPEYADILTLKYLYGYSNVEIADICGISEGNVRVTLFRARESLNKILRGDSDG